MEIYLVRNGPRLVPAYAEDAEKAAKIKPNQVVKAKITLARNLPFHRKFIKLVEYVASHHDVYDNKEKALTAIKIASGHCDFYPNPLTGELYPYPRSIAFDKMEQHEFDAFYENAVQAVLRNLTSGISEAELDEFVETVARF